ncbi:MAG TPA: hypothetical protein VLH10_23270 [Yinghuangia sp.]|uniref:hypothetical protein n=1 Tax=Yinghuangia sp. YIM S10712 TaxID=3436930 RepID=UPI002B771208|nr:hypothetical protein [Yinghuangia sp.]
MGKPRAEKDDDWDNWRLRLADYGIGILIALVLTPALVFGLLLAISETFRDYVLP